MSAHDDHTPAVIEEPIANPGLPEHLPRPTDVNPEAEKRAETARANAPVASGAYRDSIHVETDHTDRMVKRVVADVDYALVVEAEHGTLARSL